ncbi:GNAT family N-acetyltransferase [Phaeobacter sp. HF9A]|uniref:GNAT family N-acetyltransferase n=1 Tax=Phaeobacter sp. HF9A TaxID=2721561 RepID=UPI00142FC079|nr:GNAT family N-acetyltransferase [Phaeobacter sp. HF9A]NIZ15716.1 GNAT family N-acetyltransferase [Phaeobacter sp. HF9A]
MRETTAPYEMRPLTRAEIDIAVSWAAREGWNPGAEDAACFAAQDPEGFWGGFLDGEMVACISVVRYGAAFAFLGFYIVDPAHRGQGYGYALWQRALGQAGHRTVGLDGVVDQQENYRRSGFDLAWRNIRFGGVPAMRPRASDDFTLTWLDGLSAQVAALDARVFPAPRPAFWQAWLGGPGHVSVAAHAEDGEMQGFGTLRRCAHGAKIGPLLATSRAAALAVLAGVLKDWPEGEEIFLDVPDPNGAGVQLARDLGLSPVFETARMYRGHQPELALDLIYGVTSFELG